MKKIRRLEVLDCTLRDGGMGLEDAQLNGLSNLQFSKDKIAKIIDHLSCSNLEIIELGAIEKTKEDKSGYCIYQDIQQGSININQNVNCDQKFTLLFRGPDTPIEEIPQWDQGLCRNLRVIIRYSELKKSLKFCKSLSDKGYKVFIQPMVTSRYSDPELDLLVEYANEMEAYALYIVDSYGHMHENEINRIYSRYTDKLSDKISIGFHAHNNINLAFSNAKQFLSFVDDRDIIIDSTVLGMGQGAGNLQTELISYYLKQVLNKNYNTERILEVAEIVEDFSKTNLWGYSVLNLLPAIHKAAYKYSTVLRNKYGLKYYEIDQFYSSMPDEYKNRYTPESLEKHLLRGTK
jgi:4-hydroxy 2-oxovalerate aldolase